MRIILSPYYHLTVAAMNAPSMGWTEELDEHMDPGIGIGMERTEILDERTNGRNGNGERTGAGIG